MNPAIAKVSEQIQFNPDDAELYLTRANLFYESELYEEFEHIVNNELEAENLVKAGRLADCKYNLDTCVASSRYNFVATSSYVGRLESKN